MMSKTQRHLIVGIISAMTRSGVEPLRAPGLFDALTPAELEPLVAAVTRVEVPAVTTFVR